MTATQTLVKFVQSNDNLSTVAKSIISDASPFMPVKLWATHVVRGSSGNQPIAVYFGVDIDAVIDASQEIDRLGGMGAVDWDEVAEYLR